MVRLCDLFLLCSYVAAAKFWCYHVQFAVETLDRRNARAKFGFMDWVFLGF
jgi:hypothetical protein